MADMVVDGRHGSWWQTSRNWILIAQFLHWLNLFFCFAQFIVPYCVLCNPSILKIQGQEYYGIINISQCCWPSKDALSLNRCILLYSRVKVQTPSAISSVRLFAVSCVELWLIAIVSDLAPEHHVVPNISCVVRMDVHSGSQWTVMNWIFYGLFSLAAFLGMWTPVVAACPGLLSGGSGREGEVISLKMRRFWFLTGAILSF
jgi:hypothetical protein